MKGWRKLYSNSFYPAIDAIARSKTNLRGYFTTREVANSLGITIRCVQKWIKCHYNDTIIPINGYKAKRYKFATYHYKGQRCLQSTCKTFMRERR